MEAVNLLSVNNLCCSYDGRPILSNFSFSLRGGEALAIVGRSGSGKTTLAYCLTGIIPNIIQAKVTGEILLNGKSILGKRPSELVEDINIVMQSYEAQIFGLSVEEDIRFGLENLGLEEGEIKNRVEFILKVLGLEKYRKKLTRNLSGGLKQRLAIASTVAMNPKFLVMDEPTSNLDWKGIRSLVEIVETLKEHNVGVVLLTRRIKGLETCLDKVIRLNDEQYNNLNYEYGPAKRQEKNLEGREETLVELQNVWFKYEDDDFSIKDISLSFKSGKVYAIMGSNGSGKTTLIKLINGLIKPQKGKVLVLGKDTRKHSTAELARYVAIVFQDPEKQITFDSVAEEATFGCKNLGLPLSYAYEALEALKLKEKSLSSPFALSTGEKVRLSIASALAMKPKLLILDEPTTGQDEATLKLISGLIKSLKEEGKAVVVVTHDSDFALSVADEVLIMHEGMLVVRATPSEVLLDESTLEKFELEPPSYVQEKAFARDVQ
ncbi:MAG: ABC transporter ATP-binding protein [Thermoproteota archaeon]